MISVAFLAWRDRLRRHTTRVIGFFACVGTCRQHANIAINSFGLVGIACTVTCPVATYFSLAFQDFFFFFCYSVFARRLRTSRLLARGTDTCCCDLLFQLGTPPGIPSQPESRRITLHFVRSVSYKRTGHKHQIVHIYMEYARSHPTLPHQPRFTCPPSPHWPPLHWPPPCQSVSGHPPLAALRSGVQPLWFSTRCTS